MLEKNAIYSVLVENKYHFLQRINPNWFINQTNKQVYKYILIHYLATGGLDINKLKKRIDTDNLHGLIKKGLFSRIDEIQGMITVTYPWIIKELRENFVKYKHADLMAYLTTKTYTDEMKSEYIKKIHDEIVSESVEEKFENLNELLNKFIVQIENGENIRFRERSIPLHLAWSQEMFDKYINPVTYIIGAAPGFNKTSIGINLLIELTISGKTGMVFTWEDTIDTFRNKWIAIKKKWNLKKVMHGHFTDEEIKEMKEKQVSEVNNKIWVTNEPYNIQEFSNEIERQMAIRNYHYIFIDFLTLFNYYRKNEPTELTNIMREFVRISNKYYIPIICLSQIVTKDKETDGDYLMPSCKDLFGSGSMEQMARNVITIGGIKKSSQREIFRRKTSYGAIYNFKIEMDQESGCVKGMA